MILTQANFAWVNRQPNWEGNLIAYINVGIQHVICRMFVNCEHVATFQQE
jgi:hypothetical protein